MSTRRTGIGQALAAGMTGTLEERRRQRELERAGQAASTVATEPVAVVTDAGAEPSDDTSPAPPRAAGRSGTGALFAGQKAGLQSQVDELKKQLAEAGTQILSVDQVRKSRFYNRYELDLVEENPDFKKFVESIRASRGNVVPVLVRSDGSGTYELVYGHRRWAASRIAGTPLLAQIRSDITDELAAQLQVLENAERQSPSILDKAYQIESHMGAGVWGDQIRLAESLGMARSYVSMLLNIARHLPKTLQMAHPNHHKITFLHAKGIAQVASRDPDELKRRIEWVRQNKASLSAEEATAHLLRGAGKASPNNQRVEFTMTKNSVTLKARGLTTARAADLERRIKELLQEMGLVDAE